MIESSFSRRGFLQAGAAAGALAAAPTIFAIGAAKGANDSINIALIGCGGLGSGAIVNALNADKNTRLVAIGDVWGDKIPGVLNGLKGFGDRTVVAEDRRFSGLDAYKAIMALPDVDLVILTTPPGFRPLHIEAAVEAGKHIFAEKPLAVDPAGWRKVKAATDKAKEKGLSFMTGFCYRWDMPKVEAMNQVLGGNDKNSVAAYSREILGVTAPSAALLGDVKAAYCHYNTGGLWCKNVEPSWTKADIQLRNWLYYTWLSGDHIVEQGIHNIDKISWVFNDEAPIGCTALAGRQSRTDEKFGNVYDHFAVRYDFSGNRYAMMSCRQQDGTASDVSDRIIGSNGYMNLQDGRPQIVDNAGKQLWRYNNPKGGDMYNNEHKVLNASIRAGKAINCAEQALNSVAMGIMGRIAGYTGQYLSYAEFLKLEEDLFPKELTMASNLPFPAVAMPGQTRIG